MPNAITYVRVPNCHYKIGATGRPIKARSKELSRKRIVSRAKYATTVPFALELALQRHFDTFRVRRQIPREKGQRKNQPGELFSLPRKEVESFTATVASVERWVLLAEESRLELEIMQMEACAGLR